MNWLDLIIALLLVAAFFRGMQAGFVQQFFSTLGVVVGIVFGAWIQGYLIGLAHSAQSKSLLALMVILTSAILFMTLGEFIGLRLKNKLERIRLAKKVDQGFGCALALVSILAGVWFGSAIFNNVPAQGIQQQIHGSRIVTFLNSKLPSAPAVIAQIGHYINPNDFPRVFTGLEPRLQTDAPLPELGELRTAVEHARKSVVKVAGEGCGGIVEGTGFVADDNLIITNAHVIAGVPKPVVIDTIGNHSTEVVWFNTSLDLAVLRTRDLTSKPLGLNGNDVASGTKSVVLGYPGGDGFTASPAAVLDTFLATGRDIYNRDSTQRRVHSVKAQIRQGNSGGPLLSADGKVIGVVFAESTSYPDVGYALTMDQVIQEFNQAKTRVESVSTGVCAQ